MVNWLREAGTFKYYEEMNDLMRKAFAKEIAAGQDVSLQADIMGDDYRVMVDFKEAIVGTYEVVKVKLEAKLKE
jgi:hypothetical protein